MANRTVVITGMGIVSSIGYDLQQFNQGLHRAESGLTVMDDSVLKVSGNINEFNLEDAGIFKELPDTLKKNTMRIIRRMTPAVQTTVTAVLQAWKQAGMIEEMIDPERISVLTAGSNLSQGFMYNNFNKYADAPEYISPSYAIQHFDTNYNGVLSTILNIKGEGMTIGGASASGNVTLIQGWRMIKYGICDICVCAAPMYDFSPVEIRAFSNLGALGDYSSFRNAMEASRPFDSAHKGFVPGQASACIILESEEHARKRNQEVLAGFAGGAVILDANHLSDARKSGEIGVMTKAVNDSGLSIAGIDYINTHGTSTPKGDEIEAEAIAEVIEGYKENVWINSTKSLVGHCMYSAGVVEVIACVCQMRENYIHSSLNLENPIREDLKFAHHTMEGEKIRAAMSNSFGFGGINSSIILTKI